MDINSFFEQELKKELQEKFKQYENKIYLNNADIVKELNLKSTDNLRKQLNQGMYKGLYEVRKNPKESYKWNKFRFFKWLYAEKIKALETE